MFSGSQVESLPGPGSRSVGPGPIGEAPAAPVRSLGRHTTYSYVHARAATSLLNEHLGGRCGVGVVVIKYETKTDFF